MGLKQKFMALSGLDGIALGNRIHRGLFYGQLGVAGKRGQ